MRLAFVLLVTACGSSLRPAPEPPTVAAEPAAVSDEEEPDIPAGATPNELSCAQLPRAFARFVAEHVVCVRDEDCAIIDRRDCSDCDARLTERGTAVTKEYVTQAERYVHRFHELGCAGEDRSHCDVYGVDTLSCEDSRCLASASKSSCNQRITAQPPGERGDLKVTKEDLKILERATELLAVNSHWNRLDDRVCMRGATKWSLYCALHDASVEVLGRFDPRRAAVLEVSLAIEDATQGFELTDRFRDFNNNPGTTLANVRGVLEMARRRVAAKLGSP